MSEPIKDYEIVIQLSAGEFELSMGRKPIDQDEFDVWARLVEKGLMNGQIDWGILYECACDAMPEHESVP
jgi:hypothetical protein